MLWHVTVTIFFFINTVTIYGLDEREESQAPICLEHHL